MFCVIIFIMVESKVSKDNATEGNSKVPIPQPVASIGGDFITEALKVLDQQQIPDLYKKLTDGISKIEPRTGLKVRDYM